MPAIWLTICLFFAATTAAKAANVEFAPTLNDTYVMPFPWETMETVVPQGQDWSFGDHKHIRISGTIEPGDAEKLVALLYGENQYDQVVVSFDSGGGDYREGLILADTIHERNATTFVGPGDTCLSACALAFMGGTEQIIRRILYAPSRFLHTEGTLGFHAPFNTSYPKIPTLNEQSMRVVADLFYAQAREAIRALQTRVGPLNIRPDFVFDFLGKGPDTFLYVDRYREASQNRITILTDTLRRPVQMNALSAKLACAYVIDVALAPAQEFGDSVVPGNWSDVTNRYSLPNPHHFPVSVEVAEMGNGQAIFEVQVLMAGRGNFICTVSNAPDGVWRVDLQGDIPTVPTRNGLDADITRSGPYTLNTFNILGPYLPWTWTTGDTLRLSGSEDEFAQVPQELRRDRGPSFDCDGQLDPAAEIICKFPLLAQADATMVEVYRKRQADGVEGLLEFQRDWLTARYALCRPHWVDQSDPLELTLSGYCLLEATLFQIGNLLRL